MQTRPLIGGLHGVLCVNDHRREMFVRNLQAEERRACEVFSTVVLREREEFVDHPRVSLPLR